MAAFTQYTIADAPEASRPLLQQVDKALGFIPNLYATFAESPALLQGALGLDAGLDKGALSGVERQLVKIAVSTENGHTGADGIDDFGARLQHPGDRQCRPHR